LNYNLTILRLNNPLRGLSKKDEETSVGVGSPWPIHNECSKALESMCQKEKKKKVGVKGIRRIIFLNSQLNKYLIWKMSSWSHLGLGWIFGNTYNDAMIKTKNPCISWVASKHYNIQPLD
jgi:hypothetical protein